MSESPERNESDSPRVTLRNFPRHDFLKTRWIVFLLKAEPS